MNKNAKKLIYLLLILVAFKAPPTWSNEDFTYCLVCHGSHLQGNDNIGGAKLNMLPSWYVQRQLNAFRKGWRGTNKQDKKGQEMMAVARAMPHQNIPKAAQYTSQNHTGKHSKLFPLSESSTPANLSLCQSCHGEQLQGNQQTGAPPLATQSSDYLLRQLKAFRAGTRGHASEDTFGQQMRSIALSLEPSQLKDIANTLQGLPLSTQP